MIVAVGLLTLGAGLLGVPRTQLDAGDAAAGGLATDNSIVERDQSQNDTYVDAAVRVAGRYWTGREKGVRRCAAAVRIRIVAPPIIEGHWGEAAHGGCRTGRPDMRLSRAIFGLSLDYRWPAICEVVAHEFGHLFGRGHTRQGLMAPAGADLARFAGRHCGPDPVSG